MQCFSSKVISTIEYWAEVATYKRAGRTAHHFQSTSRQIGSDGPLSVGSTRLLGKREEGRMRGKSG